MLSLLVCLGATALWVRSYWVADQIRFGPETRVRVVRSYDGKLEYLVSRFARPAPAWSSVPAGADLPSHWYFWDDVHVIVPYFAVVVVTSLLPVERWLVPRLRRRAERRTAGRSAPLRRGVTSVAALATCVVAGMILHDKGVTDSTSFFATCAVAAVALLALRDAVRIIAPWDWRRRRRDAFGLCTTCGYDLRAGHARCPECGAEVPSRASPPPAPATPP